MCLLHCFLEVESSARRNNIRSCLCIRVDTKKQTTDLNGRENKTFGADPKVLYSLFLAIGSSPFPIIFVFIGLSHQLFAGCSL